MRSDARWPDFVIAGAPRCGTTFLWSVVRHQRGVFMPSWKEPNFFSPDQRVGLPGQRGHGVVNEKEYLALFAPAATTDIVGEASTSYLISDVAVPALLKRSPTARFIVSIRDPVAQISSLHGRFVASNFEHRSLVDALVAELGGPRHAVSSPLPIHPGFHGYLQAACFGQQLARLYEHVPSERILVVLLDQIAADPGAVLGRVAEFLGIANPQLPTATRLNSHVVPRSNLLLKIGWSPSNVARAKRVVPRWLHPLAAAVAMRIHKLNRRDAARAPMPETLREPIRDYLAEDLGVASRILGVDLKLRWWGADSERPQPVESAQRSS